MRLSDDALAAAVAEVAAQHSGIIMANHGPIVSADTVESCVYGMEELEESCKLAILLKDLEANKLNKAQIELLTSRFKK
ncbi:class II aldolase/adducin family protein [Paraglaciecola aquimarina]|uniref:Class II aldolase/adducin family protein n=1 Tax=Paraglaciecola aquimarina TaxID=1235557 RepID=A0ABU3SYM4_9ALTE|nr:class II aldolase/adducin family protein [Paraglaciecola aquimarina]MDU0355017.1 class II aldolase/adducin family protein [Paraglaciecola aquimarina]